MFSHKKNETVTADSTVNELNSQQVVSTAADGEDMEEDTTVLEPLMEEIRKHPLENTWTLWYWKIDRTKSWSDMLNEVTSFNTVEDYWSVYYIIKPPSQIGMYNDYMLFKHGIRPMWEVEENKRGGCWVALIPKQSKALLDKTWHDLLLGMIGEIFVHSDQICGAVVNTRSRGNKVSIWTKDANNEKAILEIGRKLRELLPLHGIGLNYRKHNDSIVQQDSVLKSIYSL